MRFCPNTIKVVYSDTELDILQFQDGEFMVGNKVTVWFDKDSEDIYTPVIRPKEDIYPVSLNIEFNIPNEALDQSLYFYEAGNSTNSITMIHCYSEKSDVSMRDIFVAKNKELGANFNIGLITAKRIYSTISVKGSTVSINYDLEERLIRSDNEIRLEKFIFGTENEVYFLNERYAPLVARENNARPLKDIAVGWCSWSCFYRNVDDKKITTALDAMKAIRGTNLIQIDDGWQFDNVFAGDWHVNTEKFPEGLEGIVKACEENGIVFGLWLSPLVAAENSRYYESVKHLVRTDVMTLDGVHPYDLDNPMFYEQLYRTYRYLSHELGVKYFKLDFLTSGFRSHCGDRAPVRFCSDYRSALIRKAISTIREAVGDDVILLSCGAPILECVGIFDAQRISRDIIVPKNHEDEFYWQHWSNIKNASRTVLYRHMYNNVVFRNDPDGLVLRDYDIGEGFDCKYAEARYWATIVALSGGFVLINDEFEKLSYERKKLFTKLIPPLGISGRANDMFEYPNPTKAILDVDEKTKIIAAFQMSDKFEDMETCLSDYGIYGQKLVIKCWEASFVGKTDKLNEELVSPHNAMLYMVKDVPTEPEFLYSDINVFLGANIFTSKFENGRLSITANDEFKDFITEDTKVFAYYPKQYSNCIGNEKTVIETQDYIITEYRI